MPPPRTLSYLPMLLVMPLIASTHASTDPLTK